MNQKKNCNAKNFTFFSELLLTVSTDNIIFLEGEEEKKLQ